MVGESTAEEAAGASAGGDFVIRHWRSSASATRYQSRLPLHLPARHDPLDVGFHSPNGAALGADSDRALQAGVGAGYTSLRDLIRLPPGSPDEVRSPSTPGCGGGGGEIRIRNRLVKQAAHAYLQPMPSVAEYYSRRRRNRTLRLALAILTCGLAVEPLDACIAFLRHLFGRTRQ